MKSSLFRLAICLLVIFAVQSQVIPFNDDNHLEPDAVALEVEGMQADGAQTENADFGEYDGMLGECYNKVGDEQCHDYMEKGLCAVSAKVKLSYCQKTCGTCNEENDSACMDRAPLETCERLLLKGHCQKYDDIRMEYCKKTCGSCEDNEEYNKDVELLESYDEDDFYSDEYDEDYDDDEFYGDDDLDYDAEDEFDYDEDDAIVRSENEECIDEAPQETCVNFKKKGFCGEYDDVRERYCRKTCRACGEAVEEDGKCRDRAPKSCRSYLNKGYCELYSHIRDSFCKKSCKTCIPDENDDAESCQNELPDKLCDRFAQKDFCQKYEGIRMVVCSKSCGTCPSGF